MISSAQPNQIKDEIKKFAQTAGFDAVGFTHPHGLEKNARYFEKFLNNDYHGEMAWLKDKSDRRKSPLTLWQDTKTIIMLGMNYGPKVDPIEKLSHKKTGNISVYATGKDYHDIVKKRLKIVAREIHRQHNADVKVFVDTAPVMEKPLAEKAGIGWQGKHTNLVSRDFGSWLFLGSIFTSLSLEEDLPETDHCGSCQSCIEVCPTKAFPAPYQLDARRCISYLTIEYKGHIALEFRKAMGNRIYGCDDCLSICPWNKYARLASETAFYPRAELTHPLLSDLAQLDDKDFREFFSGSPVKRIGRDYFVRNTLIAIGNSNEKSFIPLLILKLGESSPFVRAMAVWALNQLADTHEFREIKDAHYPHETDLAVRIEWHGVDY
jgi:epoxyqueuosine reductase